MSGLHHSVAMAFGVSGVLREKGYFKTADNAKIIRKTKDMPEQIFARHQITEHCINAGYLWMDRYYPAQSEKNAQNCPISVFADGSHYIMTDLIKYREADFSDEDEFLKIVEAVARWHSCARGVSLISDLAPVSVTTPAPLTEVFRTQSKVLDDIHKRIRKSSKWSDFDICTLKSYPMYKDRIQRALQLLERTGYLKRYSLAKQKNHICHGALKEDILRVRGNKIYITTLDNVSIDYQLNDLCGLIRRREKKHKGLKHSRILEAYTREMPLEQEEEVILEAMLLYPLAFVKIITEYYKKKRTWTPVAMSNKIKEILEADGLSC